LIKAGKIDKTVSKGVKMPIKTVHNKSDRYYYLIAGYVMPYSMNVALRSLFQH